MRAIIRMALLLCLLPMQVHAAESLKFGLFPYVSPAKLVEHHGAFIRFLEKRTGQKLQLITSPDFKTFLKRTRDNEFDIILTAPHFGRLAERDNGYQRIAMTRHKVQGVYLVRPGSSIKSLSDLKGKTITIAAPTSIVYRLAKRQLEQQYGLIDGKNLHIVTTRTHNNAMYAVIKGESDAAVTGINLYLGLIKRQGPVVKKIGLTPKVPGFMLMARPGLDKALVAKFNQAAKDFSETPEGRKYIFTGYTDINDKTMKELDAYIKNLN